MYGSFPKWRLKIRSQPRGKNGSFEYMPTCCCLLINENNHDHSLMVHPWPQQTYDYVMYMCAVQGGLCARLWYSYLVYMLQKAFLSLPFCTRQESLSFNSHMNYVDGYANIGGMLYSPTPCCHGIRQKSASILLGESDGVSYSILELPPLAHPPCAMHNKP